MPPAPSRRFRRSSTAAVAVVATAMALAACAPIAGRGDDAVVDEVAAGAEDPSTGQAAASEAALEAASQAAASEAAASEAAASEAAASSEAAREAAEAEAARKAEEEAAAKQAAEEAAEKQAAEEAAEKQAAEEAAEKQAAEEAAEKQAAEEAAEKQAAEEAAAKKAAEEAAAEAARKKAEREAREAREVQTVLADLGYYEGGIDGDVGPLTEAAIEDFQAVNELEVDGVVGANTKAALASDDALPKPPPPPPPDEDDDEDGDGDRDGDSGLPDGVLAVEVAQQELVDLGYYLGPVDGDKSDALAYALQAFQQVNGITADGILGPGTSDALRDPVTPKLVGGSSTRIEIDLDHQVIHLVKGDTRVRTMPTSSGSGEQYLQADGDTANAKTPVGTFTIQRRIEGERVADLGTLYDPMYFYKGWAIHGSNSVPSYPASHGCTRLPRADALWLWDQVPNGTTVIIHGGEHTFIPTG